MWKEWTNRIRNFAKDIASPDYDEGRCSSVDECDREDMESEAVAGICRLPCDQRANAHHRDDIGIAYATAYDHHDSRAVCDGGDASSPLETPVPCLVFHDKAPLADEYASAGGSVDEAVRAEALQLSAVATPSSPFPSTDSLSATSAAEAAAAHPSGSEGQPMPSPQAAVFTLRNGGPQTQPETSGDGAVHGTLSSHAGEQTVYICPGERRGPPHARITPSPQLAVTQRSPPQLRVLLPPPSAAPMPSLSVAACEEEATPPPAAAAVSATRLAEQQHLSCQAQLQLQHIAALEKDKAQMLSDITKYQEEARAAHEHTVQYYEAKLTEVAGVGAQHANAPHEIDALRAALQLAVSELEVEKSAKTTLEARVRGLQQEAVELRARLAAAAEESAVRSPTAAAANTEALAPSERCDPTSVPTEESWRQRHLEELEQLQKAVPEKTTSLSTLASAVTAATPAAEEKEWQRLVDMLAHEEAQRGVLEQEMQKLKEVAEQLQRTLERREHEHAVALAEAEAKAQTALAEKLNAAEVQMMQSSHTYREELHDLQTLLEEEQKRGKTLTAEKQAAQDARVAAEAQASEAEDRCRAIQAKFEALEQQAKRYDEEVRERQQEEQQRIAASASKESGADLSVAVLAQVKKELEVKLQTLEGTMDQLRRMTVDTLVRLGVELEDILERGHTLSVGAERTRAKYDSAEGDADKEDEEDCVGARTELPLLQLFSSLMEECLQQHSIVLRAERVQQEWEQTYEQARQVNDSLNQQIADAWSLIGKLREELSVKEEAQRQMQARVESGDARLVEVQEQLAGAVHELQTLREERERWAARLQQSESGAESQANAVASLREELHTLQGMLQQKEAELQASQQSSENLQHVLDRFQENRQREVEALTLESQLEAEELKKQLAAARRITDQHATELEGLREGFARQLAAKDAEVTTMHRKLAEVRKALERTTSRHIDSSETSIDKRVVSQLLAKCMHAFIEQRREAEDMLKVLSGLLDWDEATQELAGLLPGPKNPQPPGGKSSQRRSGRRGLLRWLRSEVNSSAPQPAAESTDGAMRTGKTGLAAMWVEFLLKESEGDRRGAAVSSLASSASHCALGSQPNVSFTSSPPSAAAATETPETSASNQTP
ncbi:hypothetical protein CUR178_02043 [Leishmania enriettii]|uniref:GRIP domain-containing protein n=1 Tax=Leishmania enriettii TaxID=5663 RepID=A0A836H2Y0_LEIEN|nr:hypothetical protein CUR178_02043 [Leishmania enriettii]